MSENLMTTSLVELGRLIERRDISPVELTQEALDNVDRYDEQLRAFISRHDQETLSRAKEAETDISDGNYLGPLHGIPIGIKDNFYVQGEITTMGSRIHSDFVPTYSASVVDNLLAGGSILLGKLNLHEYALGVTNENPHFGTCRNPWNTSKTPGGSSGGSAVAVAANMVTAAIGSDTSGSIRIPAAACGLVGLKPSYGRISKYGCFPEAWTLDHVGPITRNVADAAMLLDMLSGYDGKDRTSLQLPSTGTYKALSSDIGGLVIGIEEEFFFQDVDDAISELIAAGIHSLKRLGATVKPVRAPSLQHSVYALTIIDTAEATTVHAPMLRKRPEDYGEDVRFLLECGQLPSAVDYLQAQQLRGKIQQEFDDLFQTVDAIVAPTLPIRTPEIEQRNSTINGTEFDTVESLMRLVGPANLLGLPSLSLPCGLLDEMPVGMQIIGPPLGEQTILNLGFAYELTEPLEGQRPTAHTVRAEKLSVK